MRTFLALLPDADLALAVDAWSARNYPTIARRTSVQNLHMTICFLGETTARQRQWLDEQLTGATLHGFELTLNQVGYFPDAQVLWLGCRRIPDEFTALVATCRRLANKAGIRVEKRMAEPHITLARRAVDPVPAPLNEPDFHFTAETLYLQSSQLRPGGPHYETLHSWWLSAEQPDGA
jgi:2'-5' RNA ligase